TRRCHPLLPPEDQAVHSVDPGDLRRRQAAGAALLQRGASTVGTGGRAGRGTSLDPSAAGAVSASGRAPLRVGLALHAFGERTPTPELPHLGDLWGRSPLADWAVGALGAVHGAADRGRASLRAAVDAEDGPPRQDSGRGTSTAVRAVDAVLRGGQAGTETHVPICKSAHRPGQLVR